ncbi:MAG: hypothetical protein DDG59_08265 [Anaerolineae bacterium]|jgi:hypothetical protein|nr:MAG: hypothetical protein DDG59_08265 [Anaerolineae bacterium]
MKRRWVFIVIFFLLIMGLFPGIRAYSAVTLKYFDVSWEASTQRVKLRWETASELDNLGFQVRRKLSGSTGTFEVVKLCNKATRCSESELEEFIFAEGTTAGKLYGDYYDDNVQAGESYTYQLIAIDTSNQEEVAQTKTIATTNQTTPTFTVTSVPPTSTSRPANPNRARTRTPTPTATVRLVLPSATPFPTETFQPPTDTPAPTLTETQSELLIPTLPLPSITLVFPDTPTPMLEAPTQTPVAGTIPQTATWFTPARLLVIGLIVMVWVILGGWFIFALRKIQ